MPILWSFAWREEGGWEERGDSYLLLKNQMKAITLVLLPSQETELLTSSYFLLKSHKKLLKGRKQTS